MIVEFRAELWLWAARPDQGWTFVSLPVDESEEIKEFTAGASRDGASRDGASRDGARRGFGAVRVEARIGTTVWRTSIFPDAGRGCYVLPVKRAVRKAEKIEAGDPARVTVEVL